MTKRVIGENTIGLFIVFNVYSIVMSLSTKNTPLPDCLGTEMKNLMSKYLISNVTAHMGLLTGLS